MTKKLGFLLVAAVLLFSSCSNIFLGVPREDLNVYVSMYPSGSEGIYRVYADMYYWNNNDDYKSLKNATFTVNGTKLDQQDIEYSDGSKQFYYIGSINASAGDSIQVSAKHALAGSYELSGEIPEGFPEYSLSPSLPSRGTQLTESDTQLSYTVSLNSDVPSEYSIAYGYRGFTDNYEFEFGRTRLEGDATDYTFESLRDWDGNHFPYVEVYSHYVSRSVTSREGEASTWMYIDGAEGQIFTNLPAGEGASPSIIPQYSPAFPDVRSFIVAP
ncbi:hypothetical protein [Salinispira pacifica]|uniref:FHA domain-containing protein n=1 Tax=Salinispira pacifica TaxID=1307761 RepID=V5WM19_9SPIO|nr:hypothetical protein [Salinispira pacifica]AHC16688.1 hypothetical protein L21SP2_3350 [Salinispira pacifica]